MPLNASINLAFPGNAKDAVTFYHEVFGGELNVMTYGDAPPMEGMPFEPDPASVAHADLTAPGLHLTAGDDPGQTPGALRTDAWSIMLGTDTVEEGQALIDKLAADGGEVVMPYELAPWGDVYGQVRDRFDVLWHVNSAASQG